MITIEFWKNESLHFSLRFLLVSVKNKTKKTKTDIKIIYSA